jgi:hypothetical protein
MRYPDTDNKLQEILGKIEDIHSKPFDGWVSAIFRQLRLDSLHSELDKIKYYGDRPSRYIRIKK